jgi:hypothetical protein
MRRPHIDYYIDYFVIKASDVVGNSECGGSDGSVRDFSNRRGRERCKLLWVKGLGKIWWFNR